MRSASNTQKPGKVEKIKQLIIAEKPSLARSVMAAIGNSSFRKMGGYFENDHYVVSYAYGHLFKPEGVGGLPAGTSWTGCTEST